MPSKKRKYNARFPAGRIKKIMQTDEEVGKVAQAVPIIISRTLELFVESLLKKALQVTLTRNAKTLSPSHVKQCILAESRFDFLRDLVKNIPDVSAAEEKELMSAESSPNSSRFSDVSIPPRKIVREDSNSSSSCDLRVQVTQPPQPAAHQVGPQVSQPILPQVSQPVVTQVSHQISPQVRERLKSVLIGDTEISRPTSTIVSSDTAIDLSKKSEEKPVVTANFYQETLVTEEFQHRSVITVNPTYTSPQPSTSFTKLNLVDPSPKLDIVSKFERQNSLPRTPITPVINIDFTKNSAIPEIKVLDANVVPQNEKVRHVRNSRVKELKKIDFRSVPQTDIDSWSTGNLQIDEDYDT